MKRKFLCALVSVSLLFMSIKIPAQAAAVTKTATGVTSKATAGFHLVSKDTHEAKVFNCTSTNIIASKCPSCGHDWTNYSITTNHTETTVKCGDSTVAARLYNCSHGIQSIATCTNCNDTSYTYTIPAHDIYYDSTCGVVSYGTEYWTCSEHSIAFYRDINGVRYTTNSRAGVSTTSTGSCDARLSSSNNKACSLSYAGLGHVYTNWDNCTESAPYTNAAYGYINGSSKTFKVYPVNISYQDADGTVVTAAQAGVTVTASSPKQTATDYFLPGNTVKLAVSGSVTSIKMNSVVLEYNQSTGYSFTMPTADANVVVTVDLNPVKVSPSVSSASISVGQTATITANATEGSTVTYSSSDATGLLVSSTGVITGKKKGTYTVTVTATK